MINKKMLLEDQVRNVVEKLKDGIGKPLKEQWNIVEECDKEAGLVGRTIYETVMKIMKTHPYFTEGKQIPYDIYNVHDLTNINPLGSVRMFSHDVLNYCKDVFRYSKKQEENVEKVREAIKSEFLKTDKESLPTLKLFKMCRALQSKYEDEQDFPYSDDDGEYRASKMCGNDKKDETPLYENLVARQVNGFQRYLTIGKERMVQAIKDDYDDAYNLLEETYSELKDKKGGK